MYQYLLLYLYEQISHFHSVDSELVVLHTVLLKICDRTDSCLGWNCQPRTRCSRYSNLGNYVCYFLESTLKVHHLLIISMVFVDHVIPSGPFFFHVSLFSKRCRPLAYPNIQLLVRPGEVPCWVETNIEENYNVHPFGEEICAQKMCWNPREQ